jgi:hypothetical protein
MAFRPLVARLALLTALALGTPAAATVVVVPTMEEMTHRSDVVVHAVVRDVVVEEPTPGRLITLTSLEVLDGLSGAKTGDVLTVYQVGGEKNGRVAWIAGAHRFVVGEELVVFAVRPAALEGRIVPYGIGFSLFRVVDGIDGRHVDEIGGDVVQLQKTVEGGTQMAAVTPRTYPTLDGFKAMVRNILAGTNPRLPTLRRTDGPRMPTPKSASASTTKE